MSVTVKVDFSSERGKVKPLHGVNNSPVVFNEKIESFSAAGIPFVRLHDAAGTYGGSRFVDIPNVFPDFDADPEDPASYDFAFTDAYFDSLVKSGCEIFYRLGVTIENYYKIKAYRIFPPSDFEKWARICEGIVRHYNDGWADGFHYNIRYWEIWNEPENPPMWQGSRKQYFELYKVTANHLKSKFSDIKVGGYASCGFYSTTRGSDEGFFDTFLSFFDEFLTYIKLPETCAPIDFFSWHLYTNDPYEITAHAKYARNKLDEHGFGSVESIFDEWNCCTGNDDQFDRMKDMTGASFVSAALSLMQDSSVDKAMYYDALPSRTYCGLYYFPSINPTKTYYSLYFFNKLYRLGTAAAVSSDDRNVTVCAAKGKDGYAVMITKLSDGFLDVVVNYEGLDGIAADISLLDETHDGGMIERLAINRSLALRLNGKCVVLVEIGK